MIRTFAIALALIASSAWGQNAHRHVGFYLRLDAGLGGFDSSLSDQDLSVHGPLGSFGVSVGGALTENLILAGHAFGLGSTNPDVTANGVTVTSRSTQTSLGAVGPELTYYFMPLDLYLSGTVGFSRLYSTVDGVDSSSEIGLAVQLALGKEWWVSPRWGLGVAGQLTFSGNRDNGGAGAPTWGTGAFVIAFSATYN